MGLLDHEFVELVVARVRLRVRKRCLRSGLGTHDVGAEEACVAGDCGHVCERMDE